MIYIVAPHCRPMHAARLLASVERQTVNARLVVIENGDAVGTFPRARAHAVLNCRDRHHASAKNVGLAWILAQGDGPWVTMDDDDYYGPNYVSDTITSLALADVTGKVRGFIAFDDGLWQFDADFAGGDCTGRILTGGTIGARSAQLTFPVKIDDDKAFCNRARDRGLSILASHPRGYCYDRRSTHVHAWVANQTIARLAFGEALYFGPQPEFVVDTPELLAPIFRAPCPSDSEVLESLTPGHALDLSS